MSKKSTNWWEGTQKVGQLTKKISRNINAQILNFPNLIKRVLLMQQTSLVNSPRATWVIWSSQILKITKEVTFAKACIQETIVKTSCPLHGSLLLSDAKTA